MEHVKELVRKGQIYSSEYKGILANHLPMALFALADLGASGERLQEYYEFHTAILEPKPPAKEIININNWKEHLGRHRLHAEYVQFFKEQYDELGQTRFLIHYLPTLMEAPGSGAFHGLIRTSYGIDFEEPSEVIEGMAYWAVSYLPVRYHRTEGPSSLWSALHLLREAFHDPGMPKNPSGKNIIERMEKIASEPNLSHYVYSLNITSNTVGELAAAMVEFYAATKNFTILHAVTGTHALRILYPFLSDHESAVRSHWASILVAALTIPVSVDLVDAAARCGGELLKTESLYTWEEIARAAIESDDDHVCKFVYTCSEEEENYGWPLYRAVAAHKAGLYRDASATKDLEEQLAC